MVALNFRQLLPLLAVTLTASAQTSPNGTLGNMILTSEGNPIVVSENIAVIESPNQQPGNTRMVWRRPLSLAVMTLGAAGGGIGVGYSHFRERLFRTLYYNDKNTLREFDYYHEHQQRWRNYAVITGSAGGTAFLAGVALFVVDCLTEKRAAIAVVPRFGRESGICVSIPLRAGN